MGGQWDAVLEGLKLEKESRCTASLISQVYASWLPKTLGVIGG
jgi:hypothetical protein